MPTLPTYVNEGGIPTQEIPKIPAPKADDTLVKALGSAAGGFKEFYGAQQSADRLRQAQEFANIQVATQQRLFDLRDEIFRGPDFPLNPESGEKVFVERSKQIKQDMAKGITDQVVSGHWNPYFDRNAMQVQLDIRHQGWKQRDSLASGDLARNMEMLLGNAVRSTSPTAFQDFTSTWEGITANRVATLGITPQAKATLDQNFRERVGEAIFKRDLNARGGMAVYEEMKAGRYNGIVSPDKMPDFENAARSRAEHEQAQAYTNQNRFEEQKRNQAFNDSYNEAMDLFPGQFGLAAKHVENPAFRPDMNPRDKISLINFLNGQESQKVAQDERLKEAEDEAVKMKYLTGKVDKSGALQEAKGSKTREFIENHYHTMIQRKGQYDPSILKEVELGIARGTVKERKDLDPFLEKGLDPGQLERLYKSQEEQRDPSRLYHYKLAVDNFKLKYGKDSPILPAFEESLAYHVTRGKDGKPLTGSEITKMAEDLTKPLERELTNEEAAALPGSWFFGMKSKPGSQLELEASTKPWLNMAIPEQPATLDRPRPERTEQRGKIPAPGPTQQQRQTFDEIPTAARAKIADELGKRGILVNDDTIKETWRRLQGAQK